MFMIRKSKNESVTEVNPAVNPVNPEVNPANPKVNKNNIQSARGFHLRRQMASCVLVLPKPFRSTETACPIASGKWGKPHSEVVRFKIFDEFTKKKYIR
jgi:hypothetical protein